MDAIMTDHDTLIEIHTIVKELKKAVYGNGRQGLLERIATNEETTAYLMATTDNLDRDTRRIAVLEERMVGFKEKNTMRAGGVSGFIALILVALPEILSRFPK